jgi:hypothetical protein
MIKYYNKYVNNILWNHNWLFQYLILKYINLINKIIENVEDLNNNKLERKYRNIRKNKFRNRLRRSISIKIHWIY